MKKSKILVFALIVVLVALGAGAVLVFGENIGLTYSNADKYTAGGTTVTGLVENLDVNWTSGKVQVEYHAGDGIIVSETGNRTISGDDELRWWLDGDTLRIQYAKSGRFRLFDRLQKTLTISLPEGTVLKTARLHLTSGDVDIPKLTADETELTVTSGDISAAAETRIMTVKATSGNLDIRLTGETENVTIKVTSGRITADLATAKHVEIGSTSGDIRASGRVGDAVIDATSGKISVRFDAFESLKINVTSGNVKAELPEDPGFTCEANMTSGDFNYRGFSRVSKDGKTYTFGSGEKTCTIKTTSGDIEIQKAE